MSSEFSLPTHCDVLVIGSGAGGLATAVASAHQGQSVVVVEKTEFIGGTTAWSGGWLWIPRNPLAVDAGIVEPASEPLKYLRSEIGDAAFTPRTQNYLFWGPKMVDFFRKHTEVDFLDGNKVPDFHATDGAANGGRSVTAKPYNGLKLGKWLKKLRPPQTQMALNGMGIASGADMRHFINATSSVKSFWYAGWRILRHMADLVLFRRGTYLVNGNALSARLLKSALNKNVAIYTNATLTDLVTEGDKVTGATIQYRNKSYTVTAKKAVVLATGGYPHDKARIAQTFAHAPTGREHFSAAPKTNTGDGIRIGEKIGAGFSDNFVSPAALSPVSIVTNRDGTTSHYPHLLERAKPGLIAVDPSGKRFTNEANSYHDYMSSQLEATNHSPQSYTWLIGDAAAVARYGIGAVKPFPIPNWQWLKSGYLIKAHTIGELAAKLNIPPQALENTVASYNANATHGMDPEFSRGASQYNKVQGEATHHPNQSLGALTKAPFYAVKIQPGSLGTFAGLTTNEKAQVLSKNGTVIPQLYAVGNDMASIFGGNYPSGGITLGPAMTFGYIAALTIAGQDTTAELHSNSLGDIQ